MHARLVLVPLALFAAPVAAHVIDIERAIATSTSLPIPLPDGSSAGFTSFSFQIPPPFPGPIASHGEQHWYFRTRLVSISFTGTGQLRPGETITATLESPRDLGKLTAAISIDQAFTNEDLFLQMILADNITSARANLIDSYVNQGGEVPEPASWAMLVAGFGLTGAVLRRRHRARGLAVA